MFTKIKSSFLVFSLIISMDTSCQAMDFFDDLRYQFFGGALPNSQVKTIVQHRLNTAPQDHFQETEISPTGVKTPSQAPVKSRQQLALEISLEAQPMRERGGEPTRERVISAVDGRFQITQTEKWPYSVHGVVAMKFANGTAWGTGTLIGPNIVLTAGHNLYDYERRIFSENLQYLPAMNGKLLPFGMPRVVKHFVHPDYVKFGREDYGLLILDQPIGETTGYFGIATLDPKDLGSKTINVTGYPGDKVAGRSKIYEMWGMGGSTSLIDNNHISYTIDTYCGQSGSGVWYQEGDNYFVVGVHVLGNSTVNQATLMTKQRYQQIKQWITEYYISKGIYNGIRTLRLRENIGDYGVSILVGYAIQKLISLDLGENKIGIEGVKTLCSATTFPELTSLDLSSNNIDIAGVRALITSAALSKLTHLNLENSNIEEIHEREIRRLLSGRDLRIQLRAGSSLTGEAIPDWIAQEDKEVYKWFVRGKLIYRPILNSEYKQIVFPIAELINPLKGTFDLSKCESIFYENLDLNIATDCEERNTATDTSEERIRIVPKLTIGADRKRTVRHYVGGSWSAHAPSTHPNYVTFSHWSIPIEISFPVWDQGSWSPSSWSKNSTEDYHGIDGSLVLFSKWTSGHPRSPSMNYRIGNRVYKEGRSFRDSDISQNYSILINFE